MTGFRKTLAMITFGSLVALGGSAHARQDDIVDTAAAAGDFQTLVAAVQAAGLVDALKGDGPFTVFAPTDEAFAMLPDGTVENLLKPENKDQLVAVLTYHVVPGKVRAADVSGAQQSVQTLEGRSVDINGMSGVRVNEARVIAPNVDAANGVIHVIDRVLLPR